MTDYEKAVKEAEKRQEEIADAFAGKVASAMQGWYEQTTTCQLGRLNNLLEQTNELLKKIVRQTSPKITIDGEATLKYGDLYEKVKEICTSQGKTIMQVEKEAGVANGVIGGWRDGIPALDTVVKVADTLGVTVDYLIEGVAFPERRKKEST